MLLEALVKNFDYIHFPVERKSEYVEAPARVAVVSESDESLAKFMETYGGLLNIVPILLDETVSDRRFYPTGNYEITGSFPKMEIKCESRYPVDDELCTLCGECVAVCPLHAIDSEINIDFSKCDYCGKCVEKCPENAIDIYRYENYTFPVSQVLFLDDKNGGEYSELYGVYHINQQDEFFVNIGTHYLEESVNHNREICQYNSRLDIGCQRCIESCTYNAVYKTADGIGVNHFACEDCGQCVAACPTGAMQSADVGDEAFANKIYEKLQNSEINYKKAVFVQESDIASFYKDFNDKSENILIIILPNVYILNSFHFLLLFRLGFGDIFVYKDVFKESNLLKHIQFTNSLLSYAFSVKKPVASGFAPAFAGGGENIFTSSFTQPEYKNRRKFLTPIFKDIYEKSENKRVLLQEKILNTFGNVVCDEQKCSLCLACLNHCKIGSLMANSHDYTLSHIAANCIQCSICAEVCPENALEIVPGLLLDKEFFEPRVLAKDEPAVCAECGKIFGNKKSLEQVRNKLKTFGRDENELDLLKYCDECRVRKQLEVG